MVLHQTQRARQPRCALRQMEKERDEGKDPEGEQWGRPRSRGGALRHAVFVAGDMGLRRRQRTSRRARGGRQQTDEDEAGGQDSQVAVLENAPKRPRYRGGSCVLPSLVGRVISTGQETKFLQSSPGICFDLWAGRFGFHTRFDGGNGLGNPVPDEPALTGLTTNALAQYHFPGHIRDQCPEACVSEILRREKHGQRAMDEQLPVGTLILRLLLDGAGIFLIGWWREGRVWNQCMIYRSRIDTC